MAFSFTYITQAVDTSNTSEYTFSGQSIGVADAKRHVIVTVVGRHVAASSINSVTIGGISATEVVFDEDSSAICKAGIYVAAVPTGTTADIVVTWQTSIDNCGIAIYRMIEGDIAPTETASDDTQVADILSASLTIQGGGAGVGIAMWDDDAMSTNVWTGLSENFDTAVQFPRNWYTGGLSTTAGTASRWVETTEDTSLRGVLVLAAFKPIDISKARSRLTILGSRK